MGTALPLMLNGIGGIYKYTIKFYNNIYHMCNTVYTSNKHIFICLFDPAGYVEGMCVCLHAH